ncbi:MAG: hypothetical protein ACQETH_09550 [Candidatus Rifleibacteriota bacterium]
MAKDKKKQKKKYWQEEEEGLTPVQKGIIVSLIAFIPFFFFILLPVLARDHFVEKLKIPPEIFLSPPHKIDLVQTTPVGQTFKVNINGVEFKIPVEYTPIKIKENFIKFSCDPLRLTKTISAISLKEDIELNYTSTGFARWFMPNNVFKFLQVILRATWHPIRLMFKAQFYATEGIASKIFEARWSAHYRGFILPTPGQRGYVGRVFRTNGSGYFEFAMQDEINRVTLQQWVSLAMKIKPPNGKEQYSDPYSPAFYNLETQKELALKPERQVEVLSRCLNEFFRTKKPMWLIPIAIVMKQRGFNAQVMDLHKQYLNKFAIDSPLKDTWNEILDQTVASSLEIKIDPSLNKQLLKVHCKNLTERQIKQILIKIKLKYKNGKENTFIKKLLSNQRLFELQTKDILIDAPSDISLVNLDNIDYRIMQIDFIE